jgi:hypothetical protein
MAASPTASHGRHAGPTTYGAPAPESPFHSVAVHPEGCPRTRGDSGSCERPVTPGRRQARESSAWVGTRNDEALPELRAHGLQVA